MLSFLCIICTTVASWLGAGQEQAAVPHALPAIDGSGHLDEVKAEDLFVRKETWAETMVVTRAKYTDWCGKHVTARFAAFESETIAPGKPAVHISVNVSGLNRLWLLLDGEVGMAPVGGISPLGSEVAKSTVAGYMNPVTDYYTSYLSLAPRYGFYSYPDFYRSTPGQFGARASRLYEILRKGHHGVNLSSEELHRITVWLDSISLFYGVYESEGGKAQLRGEIARPTLE